MGASAGKGLTAQSLAASPKIPLGQPISKCLLSPHKLDASSHRMASWILPCWMLFLPGNMHLPPLGGCRAWSRKCVHYTMVTLTAHPIPASSGRSPGWEPKPGEGRGLRLSGTRSTGTWHPRLDLPLLPTPRRCSESPGLPSGHWGVGSGSCLSECRLVASVWAPAETGARAE